MNAKLEHLRADSSSQSGVSLGCMTLWLTGRNTSEEAGSGIGQSGHQQGLVPMKSSRNDSPGHENARVPKRWVNMLLPLAFRVT